MQYILLNFLTLYSILKNYYPKNLKLFPMSISICTDKQVLYNPT